MKTYTLHTNSKKLLADTFTPVSVYLKIRDKFPNSLLLESSDYHANDNSFSFICFNPIANFSVENNVITKQYPDNTIVKTDIRNKNVVDELAQFSQQFITESESFKFINNGLFGYISYDAIQYFEKINIKEKSPENEIPLIQYAVYQNIIAINHFNNEAYIFCHSYDDVNNIAEIEQVLQNKSFASFSFKKENEVVSNLTDEEFKRNVTLAKKHCLRGDVFQLVLSRRFSQEFKGDEFNVYRALRSINPSPYLFYFDYGNYKIFGSSPEAQIIIKDNVAEIHPIAGTFKRTGNDEEDAQLAKKLTEDAKENSEHVMLVDLARNDLSRNCNEVKVEKYKEVQFFSHVIHLVSKVTGKLKNPNNFMNLVANTFPAGTLTGAPKVRAMELIEEMEQTNRSFYGGAIGFMDFKGNFNHAIMIRSFLSKNHKLYFQAGAGIVESSTEENETQEVYNKLSALQKALDLAETI
ncbi:anthranilate synthase component I family protein [Flavobacterium sp. F372]|uniref:Anthranilate synthase component 1 n=1 Tax=Flavobacterium bernardetii TaxID=2813823 RepID=A0ABR7IW42_9FLAO|nr:anthranilate synthase component I family protein [Flavobacterium bernardetii]MBC5833999.1 anthranilate synthase component I family protein [Flavobacterium bernardetii]NHF69231.1 anthranilate synthase component I family protein [Flavobacterium bernardetii]